MVRASCGADVPVRLGPLNPPATVDARRPGRVVVLRCDRREVLHKGPCAHEHLARDVRQVTTISALPARQVRRGGTGYSSRRSARLGSVCSRADRLTSSSVLTIKSGAEMFSAGCEK